MLKAYKYRLYPDEEQVVLLAKHFGSVRWIYNWALSQKIAKYQKEKKSISIYEIMKLLPDLKKDEETAWLKEVNAQSLQSSLFDMDAAFTNFFKKRAAFPKFKSKHQNRNSFHAFQNVELKDNSLWLPKFKSPIKMVKHRDFEGQVKGYTVSKTPTGKYFVSVLVETTGKQTKPKKDVEKNAVGIDLGLTNYATLSTGEVIENPCHLKKRIKRLKRLSQWHSRKKKGSRNKDKSRIRLARQHEKVANCRKDFLHKLTHKLTRENQAATICIEDLDVKQLQGKAYKNLSRAIGDASWGMFREFLTYKCQWYGKNLRIIGRFEASSKTCLCGVVNGSLTLKDRVWTCQCGLKHDRDQLAAENIKRFAFQKQNTICSVRDEIPSD